MGIEEQIKQIEKKMPGISSYLRKYCGGYDRTYYEGSVKDMAYKQTRKHHLVAALWNERYRDEDEMSDYEWVALYYKEKGQAFEYIGRICTEEFKVLGSKGYDLPAKKDKSASQDIRIWKASNDKVEIYLTGGSKGKGCLYEFELTYGRAYPVSVEK
jgi:hypothetical protein